MRKTSIASIIKRKREDNNESISVHESVYSKYEIYNYKRGAYIVSNSICLDDISIISKGRKENENSSINERE